MQLALSEIAWLLLQLEELCKKMPRKSRYLPYYDARSWDLDDLFRAFREETLSLSEPIWTAVQERAMTGEWPKVAREVSFWLRERLSMALHYCQAARERANDSGPIQATRPKDGQAVIKWLLMDVWLEHLSDIWLRDNARSYVSISWAEDVQSEAQLERYLHKLETE